MRARYAPRPATAARGASHLADRRAPRAGKTTLVSRIVRELQASGRSRGVTTRELRERGERVDFHVEAIRGDSAVMAHVAFTEGPWVGRYRVDVPDFEGIALPALEQGAWAGGVAVIDELGQMELYSSAFVQAVQHLFEQDVPLSGHGARQSTSRDGCAQTAPRSRDVDRHPGRSRRIAGPRHRPSAGNPGGRPRPFSRVKGLIQNLDGTAAAGSRECCPDGLNPGGLSAERTRWLRRVASASMRADCSTSPSRAYARAWSVSRVTR